MDASDLRAIIEQAVREYGKQRVRIKAEEVERLSDHSKARASGLGSCALKTAYERLPTEDIERLLGMPMGDRNINLMLLMQHGTEIGAYYANALVSFAARRTSYATEPEFDASSEFIVGKADVVLTRAEGKLIDGALIEIKYTSKMDGTGGDPKYHHALQLLAYTRTCPYTPYLMTVGKGNPVRNTFRLWRLVMDARAGGCYLIDEEGEPLKEKWNDPDLINQKAVSEYAAEQLAYADAVAGGNRVDPPIEDPLNNPKGWQCLNANYKEKIATPNCPFCAICHGITEPLPYQVIDGEKQWYPAF